MFEVLGSLFSDIRNNMRAKFYARNPVSITKVYILALTSIAILAIFFQVLKFSGHSSQLETVKRVRELERHLVFVEKARSSIVEIQITTNEEMLNKKMNLAKTNLKTLDDQHSSILALINNSSCFLPKCSYYSQNQFFEILSNNFLIDKKTSKGALEALVQEINDYSLFIVKLGRIYENKIKSRTHHLLYLDMIFLGLLIMLLCIQGVFGFKPAVDNLTKALSVRSEFISRISHEIRNPMNSIMGMADILKSTRLSSEQRQYVETLQRSSEVLLEMLNNLVDFSGAENKSIQLKTAKFDIYKLVDKVVDVISIPAHDKGLEVFVDIDPNIPQYLVADFVRIEQVLLNLFNNALKFTNKGYITLKVKLIDETESNIGLKFTLKDTGIGIEKNKMKEIFKSFVQEDSSIKRKYGGSGLGLAICKEIIELMDSKIYVESEKNVGSEFYFSLEVEKVKGNRSLEFSHTEDEIVFLANQNDLAPIEGYLKSVARNNHIFTSHKDLQEHMISHKLPKKVIVDDTIGIINMINVVNLIKEKEPKTTVFALMRSNFPKENIDLIRKNGYVNFLIKPFRQWHLRKISQHNVVWAQDLTSESNYKPKKTLSSNIRILAVDDANDNLFLMKEMLSHVSGQIDFAKDGLEACEKVGQNEYDIIFMDIQMPVMDGYTAIRKIRSSNKEMPVFAVTAHAGLVEENKCIEAGFNGRITKPISREKLVTAINESLATTVKTKGVKKIADNGLDKELIQKLLPKYLKARREDLQALQTALDKKDFHAVNRLGHKIKGSARSYGFDNIGELGKKLELLANSKDIHSCSQCASDIAKIISETEDKIKNQGLMIQ